MKRTYNFFRFFIIFFWRTVPAHAKYRWKFKGFKLQILHLHSRSRTNNIWNKYKNIKYSNKSKQVGGGWIWFIKLIHLFWSYGLIFIDLFFFFFCDRRRPTPKAKEIRLIACRTFLSQKFSSHKFVFQKFKEEYISFHYPQRPTLFSFSFYSFKASLFVVVSNRFSFFFSSRTISFRNTIILYLYYVI